MTNLFSWRVLTKEVNLPKTRIIDDNIIINKVCDLVINHNLELPKDIKEALYKAQKQSNTRQEKDLLDIINKNAKIAKEQKLALCQDTGISCFFVEFGKNIKTKTNIDILINKGLKKAYKSKLLRPSIIDDPLNGKNSKFNTPASISMELKNSDGIKISYLAKGGGSENATGLFMLDPADGFEGIKKVVMSLIKEKAMNACPPIIVGIAIGGTADKAILYSKKALLRRIGNRHPNKYYAKKEEELKKEINKLGIGVMGLKGNITALDVFIEALPRHIATLAVGVSILCHSARRGSINL